MSGPPLLDTNVLLRHFLGDHPDHSPRATALIQEVGEGKRQVRLSDTVVFETVFTLEKVSSVPRPTIRDGLSAVLALPGVVLPGKRIYEDVFDLWIAHRNLSFADSYHLCLAKHFHLDGVITFDNKMHRLPGVQVREP